MQRILRVAVLLYPSEARIQRNETMKAKKITFDDF